MTYFEQCVIQGEWDKAEKYLSGFKNISKNECLMQIISEMNQKNSKALNRDKVLEDLKNMVQSNASLLNKIKFPMWKNQDY